MTLVERQSKVMIVLSIHRKKLDFRDLPDELVTQLMHCRNNIPRKSLNYRTPLEVFLSHVTEEQLSPFF